MTSWTVIYVPRLKILITMLLTWDRRWWRRWISTIRNNDLERKKLRRTQKVGSEQENNINESCSRFSSETESQKISKTEANFETLVQFFFLRATKKRFFNYFSWNFCNLRFWWNTSQSLNESFGDFSILINVEEVRQNLLLVFWSLTRKPRFLLPPRIDRITQKSTSSESSMLRWRQVFLLPWNQSSFGNYY